LPPSLTEALDSIVKADLLNWRDVWFHRLLWSTAAVALGLAFEGPELWLEIRHIRLDRRDRRMFFAPTRHEIGSTWKMLAFIGWVLIVLGVMGEGIFEAMVSRVDDQVQTFSDILLEDAQRQAGDARMRTAELEKEAAQLRLQMADRHITLAQRQKMLSILKPRSGASASIEFLTPSGTDAPEFSEEIREIFRDAGWKVPKPTGVLLSRNSPVRGFVIEGGKTKPELRAARKALQVLDSRVLYELPPVGVTAPPAAVMIYVGSK
jgi:hypothetical protein